MKMVSTIYGAYLSIIIILLVLMSFWSSMSKYESLLNEKIEQQISKLEAITNKPKLAVQWLSNKTLNLYIFTTKPIYVKYLILESNNTIKFVPVNKEIFNSSFIRVMDYYNGERIKIGIILLDGTIVFYDPLEDPIFTSNVDIDYSYLSNKTLEELYNRDTDTGSILNKVNTFYVNPVIGWAFNKSIILKDGSGTLYYFIPYYLGNVSWSSMVTVVGYGEYSGTLTFYFKEGSKTVDKIKVVRASDYSYVDVYVIYTDGSSWYIGRVNINSEKEINLYYSRQTWSASYSVTKNYKYFNITYTGSCSGSLLRISYYETIYGYSVTFSLESGGVSFKYYIIPRNKTYYHIEDGYHTHDTVINPGETKGFTLLSYSGGYGVIHSVRIDFSDFSSETTKYASFVKTFTIKLKIAYVVNPPPPYSVGIEVPYESYDVYQPSMNGAIISPYIRDSNQDTSISYDNYLLPGHNTLRINITVPEIYKLIINQPDTTLPSYMIYTAWLNPALAVNITNGGDEVLIKYGLVKSGATISFLYDSIVFYNNNLLGAYGYNTSITLSKGTYTIIPTEGPYKGNIFYLWVDNWKTIKK